MSTSDFKDFDIDGDGDYSDTMTDFIGLKLMKILKFKWKIIKYILVIFTS